MKEHLFITTDGARHLRKSRLITMIAVPAGVQAPGVQWHVWAREWTWRDVEYDLYHTMARVPIVPEGAMVVSRDRYPVSDDDRLDCAAYENVHGFPELLEGLQGEQLDDHVRQWRGDPNLDVFAWTAPVQLERESAFHAGIMSMSSEHLFCSVRPVNGRWVYAVGVGGHKREIGSADTQAEAEVMATAYLNQAWLERFLEIRAARCGDISWGTPVPAPHELIVETVDSQVKV